MRRKFGSFIVCWFSIRALAILLIAVTTKAYGSTEVVLHNFGGGNDGSSPSSALIFDGAGNLYGTTFAGGTGPCGGGCGTVFRLAPSGGTYTESVVYSFQGSANSDGANPLGALTADATGNFYGLTGAGGPKDCGTVFELSPDSGGSWTEKILYSFCASGSNIDGAYPNGKLIFDASGNLYGVTGFGGEHDTGVVFELLRSSGRWKQEVLYSFANAGGLDGNQPTGIIFDNAGNVFGVTMWGGTKAVNGAGVVFELVQKAGERWTEKVIHRFSVYGTNLQTPTGGLIFDAAGNLYMTMSRGGLGGAGIVRFTRTRGGAFKGYTLRCFPGPQELQSYEGLVFDSAGALYSASSVGKTGCTKSGCGFVYKLSPGRPHWTEMRLAIMHGSDGANPIGGVVFDDKGNLFGATSAGGQNKAGGVVFQITP
jgi:uncharacterized repeat protein (TIGR03803 family)